MKKILLILLVAGVMIQFFPIDRTNPEVNKGMDFLTIKRTPESTAQLIRNACYDCHSNESRYPWYTKIQPVGWFVKDHIEEGRKHLNFSTFATYEAKRQAHKLDECVEELEKGGMPLESYLLMHQEAKLTEEQKQELINYFRKEAKNTRLINAIFDVVTPK
ncbi:heme-binding domain-containing protein [Riemerella columbina]|uniref:heme-binding domain-containing protein n=1 Tax=Riemerella columbina TaxID=103810 RepID=UPI00267034DE|nr:heme-binding domain-containing protein [Riemerella columbina]WKS95490.1 heme-binding domain-containing protein [Riemerella columbina]